MGRLRRRHCGLTLGLTLPSGFFTSPSLSSSDRHHEHDQGYDQDQDHEPQETHSQHPGDAPKTLKCHFAMSNQHNIIIGPMCTWGPIIGSQCLSVQELFDLS